MILAHATHDDPTPPAPTARQLHGLGALELMLATGWQIDYPVLVRLSWACQHAAGTLAYHFILARDSRRSLVVIDDSPELRHFILEHSIAIT